MLSILASIGGPILGLFTNNVSYKAAKIAGGVAAALLLVALLSLGKCAYDRNLISTHDATRDATIANSVVNADRAADTNAADRAQAYADSQANLADAMANAAIRDPGNASKPVGPVSQSYYDNLPPAKGTKK